MYELLQKTFRTNRVTIGRILNLPWTTIVIDLINSLRRISCPYVPTDGYAIAKDDGHGITCVRKGYVPPINKKKQFNMSDFSYEYLDRRKYLLLHINSTVLKLR